jgi:putative phage-type endonuclease
MNLRGTKMKIVKHEQNTKPWHQWRKKGLGGSDAAAILGKSPYMTAFELYLDKVGRGIKKDDSSGEYIFARGHETEEMLRGEIFALTGKHMAPICVEDSEHSFLRASLDGYESSLGILEAKLVGKKVLEDIKAGIIPPHHFIQVQHSMRVAGVDVTRYFAHDLGKHGVLLEVKADQEFQKRLLDAEVAFWERVKLKDPPALTADDYFIPTEQSDFKNLKKLKKRLDLLQTQYDTLEAKIKESMPHPKVACAGVKIITIERQGSIGYSQLPEVKALSKEYLEQFRGKPSTYKKVSFEE